MRRIPQLDGLRALAILMVFATHALGVPLLWMGVDLFFVLSGYLITGILLRLKERRAGYFIPFYLRRARRILPPYLAFLFLATLIFHLQWVAWLWCVLFSANLGLAFGKINDSVLTPLWSLAVEEQFYLLWPCVVLLCGSRTLKRVALIVLLVSPFLRAIVTPLFPTHFPIYFLSVFRADTLCAGAFIAIAERGDSTWIRSHFKTGAGVIAAAALLFAALSALPSFRTGSNGILFNAVGYSLISAFFAGTLVVVLGLQEGITRKVLTWPALRYLGRVSYTFYLWHWAVLILLSTRIHSEPLLALLGFALTAAIATVSWHVMEMPTLSSDRVAETKNYQPAASVAA